MVAIVERLDRFISVRTFGIAFAVFFLLMLTTIIAAGLMGEPPQNEIEKIVTISNEETVPVTSGDLSQMDITEPPPQTPAVTEAGKPQPKDIQEVASGLTEDSPDGKLPIVSKVDGLTPFKAYSAEFMPDPAAKALVSFVMVDYGLSQKNSSTAISQLPSGVSFALDAYTRDAQKWTSDARKLNHEVWLSLPLQAKNYPQIDTGPKTVLAAMSADEAIKTRLPKTLGIATGYAGLVTDNASAFASASPSLQKILSSAAERGLGIVQSDPSDKTFGPLVAQTKAPFAQANLWLDGVSSDKDLLARFIELEASAVKNKKLIVFFRPYPATIAAISKWSKDASTRGIQLAPLSAVITK